MTHAPVETTPHIGIVAGTAEGAALCYRTLCHEAEEFMGRYAHPEITLHTFSLQSYFDLIDHDDWTGVARLLSQSANKLAQAGADLIICPNNTLHRAYDLLQSPVPWLHIAAVVAEEAAHRGFHRLGLLGTRAVMEDSMYSRYLGEWGIEQVIPPTHDRLDIQHIIRRELIPGRLTSRSRDFLLAIVNRLRQSGCDAVILGCTELPLIISEEHSPLALLDSTQLLARAALKLAVGHSSPAAHVRVPERQPVGITNTHTQLA
jgi:aspartate racemase